jgi:hypothetical protein
MPITYNIETDYLYNKGIEKAKKQLILNMLEQTSLTLEQIAKVAETPLDVVIQVKNKQI